MIQTVYSNPPEKFLISIHRVNEKIHTELHFSTGKLKPACELKDAVIHEGEPVAVQEPACRYAYTYQVYT